MSRQGLVEYHMKSKEKSRLQVHGQDSQHEGRVTTISSAVLHMQPNQSAHGHGIAVQESDGIPGHDKGVKADQVTRPRN